MSDGFNNFVQSVTLTALTAASDRIELANPPMGSPFALPIDGCSYVLLMERESVAGGGCRPVKVEIIAYDGYADEAKTILKVTERGVGDTTAQDWTIGAVVQQPFLKEHFQCLAQSLCGLEALAIDQVGESLRQYAELLRLGRELVALQGKQLATAADVKKLFAGLAEQEHNLGVIQQDLKNVALTDASQDEYYAEILRGMGQSGVFLTRQYTYGGQQAYHRPFASNYNALGIHNHNDFSYICGMAEGSAIIDGRYIRRRHTDYSLRMPDVAGSGFLATVPVPFPAVPPDVAALPADQQYLKMREYFEVAAGLRPASDVADFRNAFTVCMTYEEMWDEEFSVNIADTFRSGRHQINASSIQDLLDNVQYFNDTGLKDDLENTAFWHCGVRGVDRETGLAKIFIRKSRVVMMPVGSLADYPLKDLVEPVDDVMTRQRLGLTEAQMLESGMKRFRVKSRLGNAADYLNAPELLDELMHKVPGLDGVGAAISDRYSQYGRDIVVRDYGTANAMNAGYYHRFYSSSTLDASNRSDARRGFNDPTLFVAATTREQVVPVTVGSETKRFSRLIPLELVVLTPLHTWNPNAIPAAPYSAGLGGAQGSPVNGWADSMGFYRTPGDLFVDTATNASDPADTVRPGVWVRCGDGVARKHVASGVPIILPSMPKVGGFRCRYPIPFVYHEGSYAHAFSQAVAKEQEACQDAWAAVSIQGVAESLRHEKRLLTLEKGV